MIAQHCIISSAEMHLSPPPDQPPTCRAYRIKLLSKLEDKVSLNIFQNLRIAFKRRTVHTRRKEDEDEGWKWHRSFVEAEGNRSADLDDEFNVNQINPIKGFVNVKNLNI